ncbi:Uncharacterized protein Fot_29127 [Forsythia ovata]|uniref:Uncharacterized protein n=1 Tax=Forsythia ovata TaxID=205694 RepID=A0ABD1TR13_9LAMI
MASTRAKRTTAETSSRRDKKKSKKSKEDDEVLYTPNLEVIQFVATNEEKNEIYALGLFHKKQTGNEFCASSSRLAPSEKGQGCCELNEIVMNRLSQIEFIQQELERNQAQIIYLHNDLRKEMTNLNRNVQGMFAEFLNQFEKETGGSCYNVLDRQIVLYAGDTSTGRKVEDQNPKGNGVDFDTFNNENVGHGGTDFEVPFEDVIRSRAEDVEVGREDVDADDDYILVDDSTPDIPRKRLRKATAVFKSPYTSNFGSSAKIREIRTGTYALPDELNDVAIEDPYAEIIPYLLLHSGFYNAGVSSVVDRSSYDGKDPLDQLTVNILDNIPQQQQRNQLLIEARKRAKKFIPCEFDNEESLSISGILVDRAIPFEEYTEFKFRAMPSS